MFHLKREIRFVNRVLLKKLGGRLLFLVSLQKIIHLAFLNLSHFHAALQKQFYYIQTQIFATRIAAFYQNFFLKYHLILFVIL